MGKAVGKTERGTGNGQPLPACRQGVRQRHEQIRSPRWEPCFSKSPQGPFGKACSQDIPPQRTSRSTRNLPAPQAEPRKLPRPLRAALCPRISNRAHEPPTHVRGSTAFAAATYFLRRFRRSRRFLEPIFLLRLGFAMNYLYLDSQGTHRRLSQCRAKYGKPIGGECHEETRKNQYHASPRNDISGIMNPAGCVEGRCTPLRRAEESPSTFEPRWWVTPTVCRRLRAVDGR